MMAYGKNALITRMDRAALAMTGHNPEKGFSPRLVILIFSVFMLMGMVGLALVVQGQRGTGLVLGALAISGAYSGIIEKQKRGMAPRDEREWGIFWKAAAIGASVPCVLAAFWMMLLDPYADQGLWYPRQPKEWQAAGLFLLGLMIQIANIARAAMTPSYAAALDDED